MLQLKPHTTSLVFYLSFLICPLLNLYLIIKQNITLLRLEYKPMFDLRDDASYF